MNTTTGERMDKEYLDHVVEMLRDDMIDAHAEMTVPTEHLRAVLDALEAALARAEGFAAVSEEELVALRCLDDAVTVNGDGMSTEALGVDWELARSAKKRLADIRAAKGGAT